MSVCETLPWPSGGLRRQPTNHLRFRSFFADPSLPDNTTYSGDVPVTANTTNCLIMMELALSPEQPTRFLTAQQLFSNTSLPVAQFEDCYLFVSGGTKANEYYMDANDAFIVGNYDLADAVYNVLALYAESGNVSTMAGCGDIADCPVVDVTTGANKTGEIGFRYCVGGLMLQNYFAAVGPTASD